MTGSSSDHPAVRTPVRDYRWPVGAPLLSKLEVECQYGIESRSEQRFLTNRPVGFIEAD